jgi:hypothetical protein
MGANSRDSSAAASAGLMHERARLSGNRAAVILLGGTLDMPVFAAILRSETPAV